MSRNNDLSNLTYAQWRSKTRSEQEDIGNQIASKILRPKFEFVKIQEHTFQDRSEQLALFRLADGEEFVLVAGNEVTIGFDADRFEPTLQQQESYDEMREDLKEPWTLKEFLKRFTTPRRMIQTRSVLVERNPKTASKGSIDREDPELQGLLKIGESVDPEDESDGRMKFADQTEGKIGLLLNDDGTYQAWRVRNEITHEQVIQELQEQGFRLPSSDEWEYLCGGGASTLFRWGDDNPFFKPPNVSSESLRGTRHGKYLPAKDFTLNWEPNCWGLFIATDTYETEIVSEPGVVRGGDGGGMVCGGAGEFLEWIPLATSYLDDVFGSNFLKDSVHWLSVRRIVDV